MTEPNRRPANTSDGGKLKSILIAVVALVVVVLAGAYSIQVGTPPPDNAKFMVFDQVRIYVPAFEDPAVRGALEIPEIETQMQSGLDLPRHRIVDWSDIRLPNRRYANYSLSAGRDWDWFRNPKPQSQLSLWIFGDDYWTEDGFWKSR